MHCLLTATKKYKKQELCHICKQELNDTCNADENYHRIWDHCHYTGEFRGPTHNICNLRCKTPKEIPLVFYNGSKSCQKSLKVSLSV